MKQLIYGVFLCIMLLVQGIVFGAMQIHAHFTDLFLKEPVPTEFNAYKIFLADPLPQDVHYLALPWTILIKKNMLDKIPDMYLDGGFTICQHFQFEKIIPTLRRIGITVLFTPHVAEGMIYEGITLLPFPHFAQNGVSPAREKDILYSFIGTQSAQKVRAFIFELPCPKDVVIMERPSWGARTINKEHNKEYRDILSRSRFSLCPRGYGVSTIRFWESLQAGAIPVILADGTLLPAEIDWLSCCVFIPEKKVAMVDEIVRSISFEQEEKMRQNCLEAYKLSSGDQLVHTVRQYYTQMPQ
ncbi:MAG: exostosin family protein [Candidatus Babeliales bacterium]